MSSPRQSSLDTDSLLAVMDASAQQLLDMARQLTDVAQELRARQGQEQEHDRPEAR